MPLEYSKVKYSFIILNQTDQCRFTVPKTLKKYALNGTETHAMSIETIESKAPLKRTKLLIAGGRTAVMTRMTYKIIMTKDGPNGLLLKPRSFVDTWFLVEKIRNGPDLGKHYYYPMHWTGHQDDKDPLTQEEQEFTIRRIPPVMVQEAIGYQKYLELRRRAGLSISGGFEKGQNLQDTVSDREVVLRVIRTDEKILKTVEAIDLTPSYQEVMNYVLKQEESQDWEGEDEEAYGSETGSESEFESSQEGTEEKQVVSGQTEDPNPRAQEMLAESQGQERDQMNLSGTGSEQQQTHHPHLLEQQNEQEPTTTEEVPMTEPEGLPDQPHTNEKGHPKDPREEMNGLISHQSPQGKGADETTYWNGKEEPPPKEWEPEESNIPPDQTEELLQAYQERIGYGEETRPPDEHVLVKDKKPPDRKGGGTPRGASDVNNLTVTSRLI